MVRDYVHLQQEGESIGWEIRSYNAFENTLEYDGRQVLLVEVEATNCTFCDGSYAQNLNGVNVEGYVVRWKYRENEQGLPVTEVEPISQKDQKRAIVSLLKSRYAGSQINFF
jgi:hypothetical protein